MKKKVLTVLAALLAALNCGCSNTSLGTDNQAVIETCLADESKIEEMVHEAVIDNLQKGYLEGEKSCEGHITLGVENANNEKVVVYALCTSGWYGFENNNFVKVSGSGVIPTKLTFGIKESELALESYEEPEDGSRYEESLKKLFPSLYQNSVVTISDEDRMACLEQEYAQAKEYLREINREAEIGDYGDFEHILLTDRGVSNDVSNLIARNEEFSEYPIFIGSREYIENDVRYICSMEYDEENHQIIFTKIKDKSTDSNYEECIIVDSVTGEITKN